jgi:hypothetical protein
LFTYSENFVTGWLATRSSVNANAIAAPDGATTADEMIEDTSVALEKVLGRTWNTTSGQVYMISCFAKAKTRNWLAFDIASSQFGSRQLCYFNVAAGAGAVGANGITGSTAFVQDVGGGWYRCVVIATASATAAGNFYLRLATADGVSVYTGDGTSSLYLWGMAVTAGDAASSYIQTPAASTVARAADVVTITNPYALIDRAWIVKARTPRNSASAVASIVFQVDDGGYNNRRAVYYFNGRMYATAVVGGVAQATLDLGAVANDTDFAIAVRWADNNFAASLNGGAIVTDTSGVNPFGLTTARIGAVGSSNPWNSTIRHIETRRTATDAELVLLST